MNIIWIHFHYWTGQEKLISEKFIYFSLKWRPTPVFLPGEFHGLRSLVGYSPWGRKELDMTEQLHFHISFRFIITFLPRSKHLLILMNASRLHYLLACIHVQILGCIIFYLLFKLFLILQGPDWVLVPLRKFPTHPKVTEALLNSIYHSLTLYYIYLHSISSNLWTS